MARTPKHETITHERDADLPPDYPKIGQIRAAMLERDPDNAAAGVRFVPSVVALDLHADVSQGNQAVADLRAVGFTIEAAGGGAYRVTNLDHTPQPIPPKAKTPTPRTTRGHRATVVASSANNRPPALGDELRVTGLYLEPGGAVAIEVRDAGGPRRWRLRIV